MSSSSVLGLALRGKDTGKRAGSVTEPDNSSVSEATREGLSSISPSLPSDDILSLAAADGCWSGCVKRTGESSLFCDGEARGHWADMNPLVFSCSNPLPRRFFPGRKRAEGQSRFLKIKLSASAERRDWNSRNERLSLAERSVSVGIPQAWHTLSVTVISLQGSPAHFTMTAQHLKQRRARICSFCEALLDSRQMAAGERPGICKLSAARGPIQLLRHSNGKSLRQRRVSEEKSSSLKRRNLRCAKAAAYIARGPAHFGGLHSHRLAQHRCRPIGWFL